MSRTPQGTRQRSAWLGPLALCLALVSWLLPVLGSALAIAAIVSGGVSLIRHRSGYPSDWTATAGVVLGVAQLFVSLMLLLAG